MPRSPPAARAKSVAAVDISGACSTERVDHEGRDGDFNARDPVPERPGALALFENLRTRLLVGRIRVDVGDQLPVAKTIDVPSLLLGEPDESGRPGPSESPHGPTSTFQGTDPGPL